MPRPRNNVAHVTSAVDELLKAVTALVNTLQTTVSTGRQVGRAAREVKVAATDTGKKIGSAVKAAWARLTPAERKARIAKMHAWRKKGRRATA
jgi:hypothetical protein